MEHHLPCLGRHHDDGPRLVRDDRVVIPPERGGFRNGLLFFQALGCSLPQKAKGLYLNPDKKSDLQPVARRGETQILRV